MSMSQEVADTSGFGETNAELLERARRARWHAARIGDRELAQKIIQFAEELEAWAAGREATSRS